MNKLDKALAQLGAKERDQVAVLIRQLEAGETRGMDVKRLKGRKDVYRARKGSLRILFLETGSGFELVAIGRRKESTYRRV